MIEIKNYPEENGKYTITQRNSRLLTLWIGFFMDLVIELDSKSDKKRIYNDLIKKVKRDNKNETINIDG